MDRVEYIPSSRRYRESQAIFSANAATNILTRGLENGLGHSLERGAKIRPIATSVAGGASVEALTSVNERELVLAGIPRLKPWEDVKKMQKERPNKREYTRGNAVKVESFLRRQDSFLAELRRRGAGHDALLWLVILHRHDVSHIASRGGESRGVRRGIILRAVDAGVPYQYVEEAIKLNLLDASAIVNGYQAGIDVEILASLSG